MLLVCPNFLDEFGFSPKEAQKTQRISNPFLPQKTRSFSTLPRVSRAPIGALRGFLAGRNFVFFAAKWSGGLMLVLKFGYLGFGIYLGFRDLGFSALFCAFCASLGLKMVCRFEKNNPRKTRNGDAEKEPRQNLCAKNWGFDFFKPP